MEITQIFFEVAASVTPIIVSTMIILSRFKTEICDKITKLTVKFDTHIAISEHDKKEFEKLKDLFDDYLRSRKIK